MSRAFEVLAHHSTPMGELLLRRRLEPVLQVDVWEVKLGEEFLMSSQFTATEEAVASLALERVDGDRLDVLVGGLGLGYTAFTALSDERVASVHVVDTLAEVIEWHRRHLVPLGEQVAGDPRCRLTHGDFFALVAAGGPFGDDAPERFDAVLVDIDHTPRHLLSADHAGFYSAEGLDQARRLLRPGGVFSLWSDDPPDDAFVDVLASVFAEVEPHVVSFPNHYTGGESACTVYVAVGSGQSTGV